jgi:MarC family membrane protein
MDPLGNLPVFLTILKGIDAKRQRFIILRELVIALVILTLFLFLGQHILRVLQISGPSLSIAGGIILFLIAIRMIFPNQQEPRSKSRRLEEPLIVPLAIPLIAGPSAIASVILIMNRDPQHWPVWLLALICAWLITGIILFFGSSLRRVLGRRGLTALERLMGMILTAVAVQMFMNGIAEFISSQQ